MSETDLYIHYTNLKEEYAKLEQSLRDMESRLKEAEQSETTHQAYIQELIAGRYQVVDHYTKQIAELEARLQKAEQEDTAEITQVRQMLRCTAQALQEVENENDRLESRAKQAEEALRELYDHVSTGGSYCSHAHPTSCEWMRKAWALSAATPMDNGEAQ